MSVNLPSEVLTIAPSRKIPSKALTTDIIKQNVFVKEVVKNGDAIKAYKTIHPEVTDGRTLEVCANDYLHRPYVSSSISQKLNESGLTIDYLNSRLLKLTDAEKKIVVGDTLQNVPDNTSSLDAIKTAYKLHKLLDNGIVNLDARRVEFNVDNSSSDKLDNTIEKLKELNNTLSLSSSEIKGEIIENTNITDGE